MFSTLVLPTKREIMKMSEKELIEKLMKIYHKLEPELKQSHPQLLAKHIAGVFQRAEPKFDFQRAEPGGWGGKTLLQIIMALLALIAAEGGTTPSGNICIGERCPPSGTPTITVQPPSTLVLEKGVRLLVHLLVHLFTTIRHRVVRLLICHRVPTQYHLTKSKRSTSN